MQVMIPVKIIMPSGRNSSHFFEGKQIQYHSTVTSHAEMTATDVEQTPKDHYDGRHGSVYDQGVHWE